MSSFCTVKGWQLPCNFLVCTLWTHDLKWAYLTHFLPLFRERVMKWDKTHGGHGYGKTGKPWKVREIEKIVLKIREKSGKFAFFCKGREKSLRQRIFKAKCRNWITELDNKTLCSYGFLKSMLRNNGVAVGRERMLAQ